MELDFINNIRLDWNIMKTFGRTEKPVDTEKVCYT